MAALEQPCHFYTSRGGRHLTRTIQVFQAKCLSSKLPAMWLRCMEVDAQSTLWHTILARTKFTERRKSLSARGKRYCSPKVFTWLKATSRRMNRTPRRNKWKLHSKHRSEKPLCLPHPAVELSRGGSCTAHSSAKRNTCHTSGLFRHYSHWRKHTQICFHRCTYMDRSS